MEGVCNYMQNAMNISVSGLQRLTPLFSRENGIFLVYPRKIARNLNCIMPTQMKSVEDVLRAVSDEMVTDLAQRAITMFQGLTDSCSGDSDLLDNPWEEYVAQVRGEQWMNFETYEEEIQGLIFALARELRPGARAAIWLQTDSGSDWLDDAEEHDGSEGACTAFPCPEDAAEDITELIYAKVWRIAADFSSPGIEEYLCSGPDGF